MSAATTNPNHHNLSNGLFKKLASDTVIPPTTNGDFTSTQLNNMKAIENNRFSDIYLPNEYYGRSDYNSRFDRYSFHGRVLSEVEYWKHISRDSQSIKIALRNPKKINMRIMLNSNANAYMFVYAYPALFNAQLITSPNRAFVLYKLFPKKITWYAARFNPLVIPYINTNYETVNWDIPSKTTDNKKKLKFNWKSLMAQIPN